MKTNLDKEMRSKLDKEKTITIPEAFKMLGYRSRQSIYQMFKNGRLNCAVVFVKTSGHSSHEEVVDDEKFQELLKMPKGMRRKKK